MDEGKKTIDEEMTTGGPAEQEAGRLTIRVGRSSLMFLQPDKQAENGLLFEPYNCRSGVSVPANLPSHDAHTGTGGRPRDAGARRGVCAAAG